MTKRDYRILYAYYAVEVILFLVVKVSEILQVGRPLDFIRYSTIACNFIMIIYLYKRHGRGFLWRDNLIPLAFTLTLAADTFMCVIKFLPAGYFLFALVETVYMLYLKPTAKNLTVRLILYAATLPVLWRVKMLTIPNAIAMVNMVQLFVNVICAWIRRAEIKNREVLLFALGITLFFGCDFSILIRTVTVAPKQATIHNIAAYVVWTCYIPAQVLLLSSYVEKLRSAAAD